MIRRVAGLGVVAMVVACGSSMPATPKNAGSAVECDRMQMRLEAAKPASGEYHAAPKPIEGQSQEAFDARVNLQKTMNAELNALYRAVERCEASNDR